MPRTPPSPSTARPPSVFTSGSTGTPKAVLHSYGNHYYNALGSNTNLPLAPGDRWLLDLPLYHVGGLGILFRSLLAGSTVVMPDRGETLDAVLSRYEVTHLSVVVTQLHRAVAANRSPCATLRSATSSWAAARCR